MYPLDKDYKEVINDFLREINTHNLEIITNGMSTQIFGEYDEVMSAVSHSLKTCFENQDKVAVSMKLVNAHLPPNKWDPQAWS